MQALELDQTGQGRRAVRVQDKSASSAEPSHSYRVQKHGEKCPSFSETFGSKPSLPPVATSAAWLHVASFGWRGSTGGGRGVLVISDFCRRLVLSWHSCGAEVEGCPMFFCCCTEEREGFDAVPVAPRTQRGLCTRSNMP